MKTNRFDRLRTQLEYCQSLPFYRRRFAETGIRTAEIRCEADLSRLPLLSRSELTQAFLADSPHGGFNCQGVVRLTLTPSPQVGFLPVYHTRDDLDLMAEGIALHLRSLGIGPGDIVVNAFSYHLFLAGTLIHDAVERLGATCIPMGPGHADQHAAVINRFGATVLVANASFALKIAAAGANGLRLLVCGGEPFSSVKGARETVVAAFGGECVAVDSYGLAEAGIVAAETVAMNGLYVDEEQFLVELVDPESGIPVPMGERGEIVVTHLQRQGLPLIRFRTGDLAIGERRWNGAGDGLVLPSGILGRVDNMVKVKGVKFYPTEVTRVLAGISGLMGVRYQILLDRQHGTDRLTLCLQTDPSTVNADLVRERFKQEMHVAINQLDCLADLDGALVIDRRV